jgi:hypothetical protein
MCQGNFYRGFLHKILGLFGGLVSGDWGNFRSRGGEGALSTIGEAYRAFLRLIRTKEIIVGECVV